MLRFLLFAILIYILYRIVKGFWGSAKQIHKSRNTAGVIDEMVQDPFCETYVPRREAVRKVIDGKEYFFCSTECAEKYEAQKRS
jgi:YHS domain-containing protein